MSLYKQLPPNEAIRRHEAKEFFRGFGAHLAYDHVSNGLTELPEDMTPWDLQKYRSVRAFLEDLRASGIRLPVRTSLDQEIPPQIITMAARSRIEWQEAACPFLDSKVVNA